MIETLKSVDTSLFLFLNGLHNSFFDFVMFWVSNKAIWIPMYAYLLYMIIKNYRSEAIVVCLLVLVMMTLSDQISSSVIKNIVMRLRPSHDPALASQVHLVDNYSGGMYGFVSSHASNCFALFTFLVLYLKNKHRRIKYWLLAWALIISYSRIYLGVHYPGDVICGALLGSTIAVIIFLVLNFIKPKSDVQQELT